MIDINKIPNQQLDVGKVLVIKSGHKLKTADIKRLAYAAKVIKIKASSKVTDVNGLLINNIYSARMLASLIELELDFYYVQGSHVSTFLIDQKTPDVVAALQIDSKKFKHLHNTNQSLQAIYAAIHAVQRAEDAHKNLTHVLKSVESKTD
uniref:hypothetical protein n=1 Tax=Polaromonas sp. E3S TaxID=1840265 RepID=UPI0015E82839|nr:hypothetical protein [Polaromonas sp. E3S]